MEQVDRLLLAINQGDPQAAADLLPIVYEELRRLAARRLAHEQPGLTLQATALVHEAYLRLVKPESTPEWHGRGHFFAAAAEAMRRILVERARHKRSLKAGGGLARHDCAAVDIAAPQPSEDVVALDEALRRLAEVDRTAADLVQLRYFAGVTLPDAAEMLGIAPRSAGRLWTFARAWLRRELEGPEPAV